MKMMIMIALLALVTHASKSRLTNNGGDCPKRKKCPPPSLRRRLPSEWLNPLGSEKVNEDTDFNAILDTKIRKLKKVKKLLLKIDENDEKFELGDCLGSGTFGSVYKLESPKLKDGIELCMKISATHPDDIYETKYSKIATDACSAKGKVGNVTRFFGSWDQLYSEIDEKTIPEEKTFREGRQVFLKDKSDFLGIRPDGTSLTVLKDEKDGKVKVRCDLTDDFIPSGSTVKLTSDVMIKEKLYTKDTQGTVLYKRAGETKNMYRIKLQEDNVINVDKSNIEVTVLKTEHEIHTSECKPLNAWRESRLPMPAKLGENPSHTCQMMVFERCEQDLTSWLEKNSYPEKLEHTPKEEQGMVLRWNIALTTLYGLVAIHKKKLIHRDIKSDNILLVTDMKDPEMKVAKLCDFGGAINNSFLKKMVFNVSFNNGLKFKSVQRGIRKAGHYGYLPPEVIERLKEDEKKNRNDKKIKLLEDVSQKSWDIFSFGIVLAELFGIKHKKEDDDYKVRKHDDPSREDANQMAAHRLFTLCTVDRPKDRPSAQKILEEVHEYWNKAEMREIAVSAAYEEAKKEYRCRRWVE